MRRGLIFDLDGVIADTERFIALATREMFLELYGVEFDLEEFRPYIGTGAVRYVEGPAGKAGIAIDTAEAVKAGHRHFFRLLETAGDIALPGARELIAEAAADESWKPAIATSSPRDKAEAALKAARVDLAPFAAFITGDMIRRPKPNAEIYVSAALAMQLPPTRCLVIEDSIAGVEAAKNACMTCLAVANTFPASELAKADRVVSSLTEVTLDDLAELLDASVGRPRTWGARLRPGTTA